MNPLRAVARVASFGLQVLSPAHRFPVGYWPAGAAGWDEIFDGPDSAADELSDYEAGYQAGVDNERAGIRFDTRMPRVIDGRGLGEDEQNAEWSDCDGDRWRYNHADGQWENIINRRDFATTWYPALPHERNAPYTEIVESSSVDGLAHSDGPLAEERPAPRPDPLDGAALGPLTRDDLMDAANAVGRMATVSPAFEKHWRGLEQRLEDAAIAASK